MHVLNPLASAVLAAHILASCLANPILVPSLTPRSQHCTNAPTVVAGNLVTLPPRHSTTSQIWCAPNSKTYIILSTTYSVTTSASTTIITLLLTLSDLLSTHIARIGDGLLRAGEMNLVAPSDGVEFHVWNTNNHQQTYAVLRAAVEALRDFMGEKGVVGADFFVFDGAGTEVGAGTIG